MGKFEAFGEVVWNQLEHSQTELTVPEGKLVVELEGEKDGAFEKIAEFGSKTVLSGGSWDCSLESNAAELFGSDIPFDASTVVSVPASVAAQYQRVRLVRAELEGFVSLRTDTVLAAGEAVQQAEALKEQLAVAVEQYLQTRDNTLAQEVLSSKYATLVATSTLPENSLESYITEYLPVVPGDALTRKLACTFLKAYQAPIANASGLTKHIASALQHPKITHHGLAILLTLAKDTGSLDGECLLEQISASVSKIAEYKGSHPEPYQPYFEESIFSPYIHEMLSKDKKDEDLEVAGDKLHYRILLQKNKLARKYTVDLLSQYDVSKIDLHVEPTKKEHKMLAVVRWYNEQGQEAGSFSQFYDYQQCSQFVFGSLQPQITFTSS